MFLCNSCILIINNYNVFGFQMLPAEEQEQEAIVLLMMADASIMNNCLLNFTINSTTCLENNTYSISILIAEVTDNDDDLCVPIDCINNYNFQNATLSNGTVDSVTVSINDSAVCDTVTSQPADGNTDTFKRFTTELIIVAASSGGGGAILVSICAIILLCIKWKVNSQRKRSWLVRYSTMNPPSQFQSLFLLL